MSFLRKLLIVPPIAIGVGLVAMAVSNRQPPAIDPPQERRIPASYIVAALRDFTPRIVGFGSVEPEHTWEAVAQVSGRVVYVNPDFVRGGGVKKGDVLVRIAPDDYELAIAQARANIESARAQIEEMRLSAVTTERSVEIERRSLDLAQKQLERQRGLLARGAVATSTVEAQESAVLAQQAKVQSLENTLALFPAKIKALEQSQAVSEAALRSAELNLERTEIAAPFDARVARSSVEISQFVGAGVSMGALDGASAAEIDVQIPPQRMASMARLAFAGGMKPVDETARAPSGLSATVRTGFDGVGASWEAEVRRISDTVDPETRAVGVIVRVPDPYGQARAGQKPPLIKGMFVEVELRAPPVSGVYALPRAAVRGGRVMVAGDDDRLAFAPVEVAFTIGDIAVLKGAALPQGTRVIVSEPSPAIAGLLLAPVRDEATEARLAAASGTGAE